jgi:Ion channel
MRRPAALVAAAAGCVIAGGALISSSWHLSWWHGLYCSLGTATTVGCDATPPGPAGWIAASLVMLTAIPLLAAAFSSLHLDRMDERLRRHHKAIKGQIDRLGTRDEGDT